MTPYESRICKDHNDDGDPQGGLIGVALVGPRRWVLSWVWPLTWHPKDEAERMEAVRRAAAEEARSRG